MPEAPASVMADSEAVAAAAAMEEVVSDPIPSDPPAAEADEAVAATEDGGDKPAVEAKAKKRSAPRKPATHPPYAEVIAAIDSEVGKQQFDADLNSLFGLCCR